MASSQSRWKGRVALVTGGTVGIGEATARLLIKEGMRVVVCARNQDRLQKLDAELNTDPSSRCLLAVQCDISKENQVLKMFQQIRSEFGQLDVCINNAGLVKKNASLLEGSTEAWQTIMNVNVIGLSICTREAVKLMREKGIDDGHIIHVSSCGKIPRSSSIRRNCDGQNPGHYWNSAVGHQVLALAGSDWFMYQASKHAVRALTECLRLDLRELKSNIRVSSVSPGHVKTEQAKEVIPDIKTVNTLIPGLSAEEVAGLIWNCINQPQNVQIHDIIVRANQGD